MGVYAYNLRKTTKNVKVDGHFVPVPYFEYAYKPRFWSSPKEESIMDRSDAAAFRAFGHHSVDGAPILAIDGEHLVITARSHYLDGETLEHYHRAVIGKIVKVGNRLVCEASPSAAANAFAELSCSYDEETGKATKVVIPTASDYLSDYFTH